jgi:diadenosine tetraphosphate (Ap4A) HIT family hydrolase
LTRFSHSLDNARPIRTPRPPPEACWFCLSSPSIDTHLVVSVGDHCYCAIAKGPLVDSHILILPIEHHPSTISLPADAESELQRYKDALQKCFKTQGKATVFFERYLQLRAGTHAHLQAVPVPLQKASTVRSAFISAAKEVGFEFDIICPSDTDPQARQALKEVVGGGANFFFVELPEGTILAHRLAPGEKLPMQFGREVMASLLGTPERGDWKVCKLDVEEETSMADRFKEQFQSFDLMQSLV